MRSVASTARETRDEQVRDRIELAAKFEAHCFVRERPDGTAIEIRGTPLANRTGFVTTYTDITEARNQTREVSALTERLTETNLRLDAAFNNMNQGLAMFDEEHRLVVRNKRYLELFKFPEDVARVGATLEDITRYSVERGFEGDPEHAVARRMEIASRREPAVYHRQMSDGRVLEIIHEPLGNGGSLALYLDVTDRDRAERSLREHAAKLEASNRELRTLPMWHPMTFRNRCARSRRSGTGCTRNAARGLARTAACTSRGCRSLRGGCDH